MREGGNGISGDARRSTPEIGKRVTDLKVNLASAQIRQWLGPAGQSHLVKRTASQFVASPFSLRAQSDAPQDPRLELLFPAPPWSQITDRGEAAQV